MHILQFIRFMNVYHTCIIMHIVLSQRVCMKKYIPQSSKEINSPEFEKGFSILK